MKKLKPYYNIYQFGREGWVNLKKPSHRDRELAQKGLKFAEKIIKEKPFLLILDEINLAIAIGLLKLDEVIEFLKKIPSKTTIVLTGRSAPKKLIEIADAVTIMEFVKHPFQKGYRARKGIEY
jgi:cob(I)alamin adenosyltransferase